MRQCRDVDLNHFQLAGELGLGELSAEAKAGVVNENVPIQILVNNAGFGLSGEFAETELTRELEMIQVNIAALTHLTKLFMPAMIKARAGRVLNVASTAAFQPGPLMAVYYATKAYVLSFSEALADELRNTGVKVTALCPGPTATGFADAAGMAESHLVRGE